MSKFQIDTVVSETPNDAVNLETSIVSHIRALLKSLSICFPASILSYDRESHIAEVQPLVKQGRFDGKWKYEVRKSYKVSVLAIQQGGFTMDVPLFRGDTGWVISSDRDTTLLKQEGAYTASVLEKDRSEEEVSAAYPQKPSTLVLHDLASGFFIPDNWGRFEIGRYKDGGGINIASALYIGQSIDTKDEGGKSPTEDGAEKGVSVSPQTGDRYENETSSSMVIERHGGIHMLSSSAKDVNLSARLTVEKDTIETENIDDGNGTIGFSRLSITDGIVKRIDTSTDHMMFHNNAGSTSFKTVQESDNIVSINLGVHGITIESTSDIHISSEGNTFINVNGRARIIANEIEVRSAGNLAVHSKSGIQCLCGRDATITSNGDLQLEGDVTLAAGGYLTMTGQKASLRPRATSAITFESIGEKMEEGNSGRVSFSAPSIVMNTNSEGYGEEGTDEAPIKDTTHISWHTTLGGANIDIGDGCSMSNPKHTYYVVEEGAVKEKQIKGELNIKSASTSLDAEEMVSISGEITMAGFKKAKEKVWDFDAKDRPYYDYFWKP